MGIYLNPGNISFKEKSSMNYVDKSLLIDFVNGTLGTNQKLICCSRPRRFGKSYAATMLCAYYDKSCDSRELFDSLEISRTTGYETHLNKYNVIYLDITTFCDNVKDRSKIIETIHKKVIEELTEYFSIETESETIPFVLDEITNYCGERFYFIIDEYDAVYRQFKDDYVLQEEYVAFLRGLFKSPTTAKSVIGAYITGILPIKKYNHQSAVSDFIEYTMTESGELSTFFGFTNEEVKKLCNKSEMDFEEMKEWYDGYVLDGKEIYNPKSVMEAIRLKSFDNYWTRTSEYAEIKPYLETNGVTQDELLSLLKGKSVLVNINTFQNDMIHLDTKDRVFTLMIHLGYFSYNKKIKKISIPNKEIRQEFVDTLENSKYPMLTEFICRSRNLLDSTKEMDEEMVCMQIEFVHSMLNNPKNYNSEEALRSTIKMAYITGVDEYYYFEELPSGTGYVDIALIPKEKNEKVILFELKWNKDTSKALSQIDNRNYKQKLEQMGNGILFVGINYDAESKKHTCEIKENI